MLLLILSPLIFAAADPAAISAANAFEKITKVKIPMNKFHNSNLQMPVAPAASLRKSDPSAAAPVIATIKYNDKKF